MVGGAGHDTFVFNSNGGQNVVMRFGDGDILQIQHNINGLHITSAADVAAHVQDHGGNAVITLGDEIDHADRHQGRRHPQQPDRLLHHPLDRGARKQCVPDRFPIRAASCCRESALRLPRASLT